MARSYIAINAGSDGFCDVQTFTADEKEDLFWFVTGAMHRGGEVTVFKAGNVEELDAKTIERDGIRKFCGPNGPL